MRSFFLALVVIGAVGATQYRGERPPELGPPDYQLKPYCCNIVENVVAELKERVAKSGGNALKLKEILDHCIKKLLVIKSSLVKQIEHFDYWIKKNGLPERVGVPGDKGDRGRRRPKGLAGIDGPKGQKGESGKKGIDGSQGHPGRMGRKGDVGATGKDGDAGDQGVRGHTTYVRGKKGQNGAAGPPGPQGPEGPRGPLGERGPKGGPGEPGNAGHQGWCLRDSNKQCQVHHDDDEEEPWKHHPRAEPEPEPELIPNPIDFEEPDEKRIYYGLPSENSQKLVEPKICPSCTDDEGTQAEP